MLMPILLSEHEAELLLKLRSLYTEIGSVGLQGDDLPVANLRCGFGSLFSCVLVCVPQLRVKARLAHSSCFAAVALREVTTAGRTIELRSGHRVTV
jgi:hypothetical protein